jgi:outer membrane protein OmpA-like peptidoglycan-associated protein
MKSYHLLLSALALTRFTLYSQVTVVPATPAPVGVVTEVARPLDPVIVRRQMSLAPKVVIVPTPGASTVVTPAPDEVVKTTKTTTVVDTPGQPRRVYNSERSVVILAEKNQSRELTYVTLPVLFIKETSDLLDAESRTALEQVAGLILEISKTEPGVRYDIEGHTSTDGSDEYDVALSAARAQRVYDELTQRYGVPTTALSAHGYGESFPMFPNGVEAQMQKDRRVLLVRTN